MNPISLKLDHSQRDAPDYRPGERLTGTANWENEEPRCVEIRLFWFTLGVAPRQVGLVEKIVIDQPGFQKSSAFLFVLPTGPYGFTGQKIGLRWAVELVLLPSRQHAAAYFNLGPAGEPITVRPEWHVVEND